MIIITRRMFGRREENRTKTMDMRGIHRVHTIEGEYTNKM